MKISTINDLPVDTCWGYKTLTAEESHTRGKKRLSWWVMIHSTNIHLDVRLKLPKLGFLAILDDLMIKVA
jgi:hypothetical protein